jgi:hypothetical protein
MILLRCCIEQKQKLEQTHKLLKYCPHCGFENNNIGRFPHQLNLDLIPACANCGRFLWSELKQWQKFRQLCEEARA